MFPDICVTSFTGAVGILLIIAMIQRPEEIIDSATGLRKMSAYADDMKKYFLNCKSGINYHGQHFQLSDNQQHYRI